MKISKFLVNIGTLLCLGLFVVGCAPNNQPSDNISLDFLMTPKQLRIHSNEQLKELNQVEAKAIQNAESMNEKYDDISKISEEDIRIQEDISRQVMDVLDSGKTIEDKSAIENIFNQLRSLEGVYVDLFEEEVKTRIELIEDQETSSDAYLDNSYLRMFMILEDSSLLIPKGIMKDSANKLEPTGEIEYIKVNLTENLKVELEELVNY